MRPPPRSAIDAMNARTRWRGPCRLMSNTRSATSSHPSSFQSSKGQIAAQSMRPFTAPHAAAHASTAARSVTSRAAASDCRPRSRTESATASGASRSETMTSAPRPAAIRAAVDPMPPPAPVIAMRMPSRVNGLVTGRSSGCVPFPILPRIERAYFTDLLLRTPTWRTGHRTHWFRSSRSRRRCLETDESEETGSRPTLRPGESRARRTRKPCRATRRRERPSVCRTSAVVPYGLTASARGARPPIEAAMGSVPVSPSPSTSAGTGVSNA